MTQPRRRATIKDVAQLAGVSPATVSQAMNGKGVVRQETAEKVRRVAAEIGYRPNAVARGLRTSNMSMLALVIRPLDTLDSFLPQGVDFFMRLAGSAALGAMEHGYSLMLVADPTRPDTPLSAFAADGYIIMNPHTNDPVLTLLEEKRIPFVLTAPDPARPEQFHSFESRAEKEMRILCRHLESAGATRIALVTGTDPGDWNYTSRLEFERWCEQRGQTPLACAVPESAGESVGDEVMRGLFDEQPVEDRPDAILCLTGRHAAGVLSAAQARGINVPNDLLLAAYSGATQNQTSSPTVTAFDLHPERLGLVAVEAAIKLLKGLPFDEPLVVPDATLHVRESTTR